MLINEAVRIAMEKGACIALPEWRGAMKVQPTDTAHRCIVSGFNLHHPAKDGYIGWMPTADDLIRDDWMLIGADSKSSEILLAQSAENRAENRNDDVFDKLIAPVPGRLGFRFYLSIILISFFVGFSASFLFELLFMLGQ